MRCWESAANRARDDDGKRDIWNEHVASESSVSFTESAPPQSTTFPFLGLREGGLCLSGIRRDEWGLLSAFLVGDATWLALKGICGARRRCLKTRLKGKSAGN
jgi:hypothetical protein